MFIEEKLSQAGQKKQQHGIGKKSFYSNTSYGFEYKKTAQASCLLKCSLKEKPRAGKAYAYQMILSFETPGNFF